LTVLLSLFVQQYKISSSLLLHKLLANYQTGGYKFRPMSSWNGRIWSQTFVSERTH